MAKWTPPGVRRLRKKLGLTQEAFAARLGVTWVSVSRWENGHSTPRGLSVKALNALAKRAR
jgi:DNA-binding transcriptional regulator YiaG